MARNIIDAFWDRKNLKRLNDNFLELYNNMLSGTQLEDLKKEINNKLNKGEVSISDINLALGKIDENFLTQSLLDKIDEVKLENGSITTEKTNFISKKTSNNLINIENVQLGKNIDSTGVISDRDNYWISDYIPFKYGEQLNFNKSGNNALAFYDANKKFITRLGFSGTTYINKAVPSSNYVRIIFTSNFNQMMVNKGDVLLPYEEYENTKVLDSEIKISLDSLLNYQKSKNLFNKNTVILNSKLDINGNIVTDSNWVTSTKISVEPGVISFTYENTVMWAVFDSNNNLISRSQKNSNTETTLNIPDNASYIVISVTKSAYDNLMANYGTEVLSYEDFGYTLVSTKGLPIKISEDIVPKISSNDYENNSDLANSNQIYQENSTSYDSNSKLEIYKTDKQAKIDFIEVTSNSLDLNLEIIYIDSEGNEHISTVTQHDDSSELPTTLGNIIDYGFSNTDFLLYNPTKKQYKISIKNLNFSNGVIINAKNDSTNTINGTIKVVGRYYV